VIERPERFDFDQTGKDWSLTLNGGFSRAAIFLCDDAPVIVSSASPIDSAGRSPISVADSPLTMVVQLRLILMVLWIVARVP